MLYMLQMRIIKSISSVSRFLAPLRWSYILLEPVVPRDGGVLWCSSPFLPLFDFLWVPAAQILGIDYPRVRTIALYLSRIVGELTSK